MGWEFGRSEINGKYSIISTFNIIVDLAFHTSTFLILESWNLQYIGSQSMTSNTLSIKYYMSSHHWFNARKPSSSFDKWSYNIQSINSLLWVPF